MADNLVTYNRFTALPPVIARYGWTPEEAESTRGRPDPNPTLSPMAAPRASEARLALSPGGSDKLRMGAPDEPAQNPYEGAKLTLVLSRAAARKLAGNVLAELQNVVGSGTVPDATRVPLMQDSLRRVGGLRELIEHLNKMAEAVQVRSLAAAKG